MDILRNYQEAIQAGPGLDVAKCESPSPLAGLKRAKLQLESKLNDINAAIDALENHPEIEQTLTLITKATRY